VDALNPDPPGLSMATLAPWLSEQVSSFDGSGPPICRLLMGGRSNLTYELIDVSGRRYVLRRPPLGHVMPRAHDMAREFRVLEGLRRAAFPAPNVYVLCEDSAITGAPFMVMDFVEGRVLAESKESHQIIYEQAGAVSRAFVQGLASLHQVDLVTAGLESFGRPSGYLARQVDLWAQQWENTKTRELPELDRVSAWLRRHVGDVPDGLPFSLVHGDYRLDNLILDPSLNSLQAVLDWEMSTLGDPVADLATALVYWTQSDDLLRTGLPVAQGLTSAPGFWTREQIVDEYVMATGFNIDHLQLCTVLACYKLAVIMESIHFRRLSGQQMGAAEDRNEEMGSAVIALTQLAYMVIEHGTLSGLNM
jgi:aminoglycoside phosphotransferase (APT) family kinase protein